MLHSHERTQLFRSGRLKQLVHAHALFAASSLMAVFSQSGTSIVSVLMFLCADGWLDSTRSHVHERQAATVGPVGFAEPCRLSGEDAISGLSQNNIAIRFLSSSLQKSLIRRERILPVSVDDRIVAIREVISRRENQKAPTMRLLHQAGFFSRHPWCWTHLNPWTSPGNGILERTCLRNLSRNPQAARQTFRRDQPKENCPKMRLS